MFIAETYNLSTVRMIFLHNNCTDHCTKTYILCYVEIAVGS